MLKNSDWTQKGLRDLVYNLHVYYGVANTPSVEGHAAADACRALRHALEVVEADEGTHAYIRANFPVGRHANIGIEERINQAVKEFGQTAQVDGQYVNQVLECLKHSVGRRRLHSANKSKVTESLREISKVYKQHGLSLLME